MEKIKKILANIAYAIIFIAFITVFYSCQHWATTDYSAERAAKAEATEHLAYQEYMSEEAERLEDERKGQREAAALYGDMIRDFAGEKALITGLVKNVYIADDENPSYIDLDYEYPDERRISIIIWPENLNDKLRTLLNNLEYNEKIFVTGKIKIYEGVVQIEVSKRSQIERESD